MATPELYNTKNRTTGHAVCNAAARLGAFGAPFFIDSNTSDFGIALVLGICNTCAALVAYFFLPETAGTDLDAAPPPPRAKLGRHETESGKIVDYSRSEYSEYSE